MSQSAKRRKAQRKRKGREFTRAETQLIESMMAQGRSQALIAKAVGCSRTTLRKYFGAELSGRDRNGRAGRLWTPQERSLVQLVAGVGIGHAEISGHLGLSLAEFQAAFASELATSKAGVDMLVATAIVAQGLAGDGNLLRFYARAKMGWNDRLAQAPTAPPPDDSTTQLRKGIGSLDKAGQTALATVLAQLGARSALDEEGPGPEDTVQ